MSETLTPKQALALWCLLGRCGTALQSALTPKIGKAEREALLKDGYVEARKQGRSQRLTVTDKGWAWAGAHLRDPLPPSFRVLQDWLERLHGHLETTGGTLADLVRPPRRSPNRNRRPNARLRSGPRRGVPRPRPCARGSRRPIST